MATKEQRKQYRQKHLNKPGKRKYYAKQSTSRTKLWYQIPKNKEDSKRRSREYEIKMKLENPIKYLIRKTKSRAKQRNIPFDLTEEYLNSIKPTHCPVFGYELNYTQVATGKRAAQVPVNSASLDRIIPSLGYVRGNTIIVSFEANRLKNNATVEQLQKLSEFYSTFTGILR